MVGEPAVRMGTIPHRCWAMAANEVLMKSNTFIKATGDMVSFSFFLFLVFSVVEESSEEETECLFGLLV